MLALINLDGAHALIEGGKQFGPLTVDLDGPSAVIWHGEQQCGRLIGTVRPRYPAVIECRGFELSRAQGRCELLECRHVERIEGAVRAGGDAIRAHCRIDRDAVRRRLASFECVQFADVVPKTPSLLRDYLLINCQLHGLVAARIRAFEDICVSDGVRWDGDFPF